MQRILTAIFLCGVSASGVLAGSITLGRNTDGNAFPFGGPAGGYSGTRFQEAYANTDFSGPITITGIDFFLSSDSGGDLYAGTYQLSLSTTDTDINNLSPVNFDGNLGVDNTLFETVALSGAPPNILSFTGAPFTFDPADGNLLLDISITDPVAPSGPGALFQDGGFFGPPGVIRYSNFGGGTTGYGLVTRFDFTTPEPGTLALLGCGFVGLLVRRLRRAA